MSHKKLSTKLIEPVTVTPTTQRMQIRLIKLSLEDPITNLILLFLYNFANLVLHNYTYILDGTRSSVPSLFDFLHCCIKSSNGDE